MQKRLEEVKSKLQKHFSTEAKISGNVVKLRRMEFYNEDLEFFMELECITMIKRSGKGVTAIITPLI